MPQVGEITTYAELKTGMADLLDRSDLNTVIGTFVQLCEADMNRKLRHHKMVKTVTAPVDVGVTKISLPPDWLELRNVEVDDVQYIYTSPDVMDIMKAKVANDCTGNLSGCFYTFIDSCIEIFPAPGADYSVYLDYYARISPLRNEATGTNWMLLENPDIYLYGALIHSAPYLRDDSRIAIWSKVYGDAIGILQGRSQMAMTSGSRISRNVAQGFG